MPVEVKIPQVGESITEVQISAWHVGEGDYVEVDDDVAELETDKATVEVPSPISGNVVKLLKQAGEMAEIDEVIALIEEAEAPAESDSGGSSDPAPQAASSSDSKGSGASTPPRESERIVMPGAKRELAERGLSAEEVPATGPGGRLLKEDVLRHGRGPARTSDAPSRSTTPTLPSSTKSDQAQSSAALSKPTGERTERRKAISPIRRRIAERLVEAQTNAALLTTFNEIDMSLVMSLRKQFQDDFVNRYGVKLGFMSFFVKAAVDALREIPQVGAQIDGNELVYQNYCDIGIAVGGGKGLVVPVLRNAEQMGFAEIEMKISDFGRRAKENKIDLEELSGGTFTITNGGIYGSLLSTPIVNPPQSGVLGMHNIVERPVVVDGQVVARPMMYIALTYDHRVVDGREAVTFLKRIKETIEHPTRMLIEA
ncbi:2-oxoglutarate dehydrogenase complex dihydrolipoyllysine-residue succinyltransferase [Stratiformator vulcanicus]|uniref:Dihydrolipoyllysine-residue succinyltransferase component of 2-oxoglutarate dehydrogenase complex n=1 Tax=Stratiformator vulcanicus TaxID=2527980 RepID=A0A517QW81_9PLAN|nr:2-oxoglutarate dehydrogenase complex dihydrolipoyllysine-residue succinyltransferase [Stratiformator vulcanicus]QDT35925.1 Dihydrolipoyllysine-residue succinyltransferase component of 2-oxoglutarate dehydrogenase complex [Stratiformator vulcanicus]